MKYFYLDSREFNIVCDLLAGSSTGSIRYSGMIFERLSSDIITCVYERDVFASDFEWMELIED